MKYNYSQYFKDLKSISTIKQYFKDLKIILTIKHCTAKAGQDSESVKI